MVTDARMAALAAAPDLRRTPAGGLACPVYRAALEMIHLPSDAVLAMDPIWSWGPIAGEEHASESGWWLRVVRAAPEPLAWLRPPVGTTASRAPIRDAKGRPIRQEPRLVDAQGRAWDPATAYGRAESGLGGWRFAEGPREARGAIPAPQPAPEPASPEESPWEPWSVLGRTRDGRAIRRSAARDWIKADGDRAFWPLCCLATLADRTADDDDEPPAAAPAPVLVSAEPRDLPGQLLLF